MALVSDGSRQVADLDGVKHAELDHLHLSPAQASSAREVHEVVEH